MAELKQSATIADIHARTYTWASRPLLKGDAENAINYFFDFCLETQSSAKILGDIFHTLTPLPEFVKTVFDRLSDMQAAGLPVYYIQGNHDLNKVPWLSLHPWPVNMHKKVVELPECGMTVMGCESVSRDQLLEFFESIPEGVDTLMLHQAEKRALPFSYQFDLSEVPEQIKNVLIGDIHNAQHYEENGTHLWYPGSPYVTSIDNMDERSFLVERVHNGETQIARQSIPGRGFYHIQIDSHDDPGEYKTEMDECEKMVREIAGHDARHNGLEPVVVVEYPPACSDLAYQSLMALREPLGVYTWLSLTGELTDDEEEVPVGRIEGGVDMDSIIEDHVHHDIPKTILKQIFQGNDTAEVLRSGLEEIL